MMRPLLSFVLCGAIAAPGLALAQSAPPSESAPLPLAPLPTVEPTQPAPPPLAAPPPPAAEAGAPAPELAPPTTVAPIIRPKAEKGDTAGRMGVLAVGAATGAAGAAAAGPVGKIAGSLIGKNLAKGLFGVGKPKTPELTVIPRDPESALAATGPAVNAAANAAPVPAVNAGAAPPKETVADAR